MTAIEYENAERHKSGEEAPNYASPNRASLQWTSENRGHTCLELDVVSLRVVPHTRHPLVHNLPLLLERSHLVRHLLGRVRLVELIGQMLGKVGCRVLYRAPLVVLLKLGLLPHALHHQLQQHPWVVVTPVVNGQEHRHLTPLVRIAGSTAVRGRPARFSRTSLARWITPLRGRARVKASARCRRATVGR